MRWRGKLPARRARGKQARIAVGFAPASALPSRELVVIAGGNIHCVFGENGGQAFMSVTDRQSLSMTVSGLKMSFETVSPLALFSANNRDVASRAPDQKPHRD